MIKIRLFIIGIMLMGAVTVFVVSLIGARNIAAKDDWRGFATIENHVNKSHEHYYQKGDSVRVIEVHNYSGIVLRDKRYIP